MHVPCVPNVDCVGAIDDGETFATVNAMADPSATDLRISLLEGGPDCDDYTETTSTVEFSVSSGSRVKEVSISFDAVLGGSIEGYDPVSDFQVCYEAPTPFIDRNDASVTTGLLPDCDVLRPGVDGPVRAEPRAGRWRVQLLELRHLGHDHVPGAGRRPEGSRLTA